MRLAHGFRWVTRVVVALALLLLLAAAGLWWWAGQEGSLEWTLRRLARGQPLEAQGVQGSLRSGWRIERLAWQQDGLKIEAEGITLEWQPLALLGRTVRLDQVGIAAVRITDERPDTKEPLPDTLLLPYRTTVDEFKVGRIRYQGAIALEAQQLAGRYAFDGLRHHLRVDSLQMAGGGYQGQATLGALAPLALDLRLGGRFLAPVPGNAQPLALAFTAQAKGPLADLQAQAQLQLAPGVRHAGPAPSVTASARITPMAAMPVPRAEADIRLLDLAVLWSEAPRTQLNGRITITPAGPEAWQLRADLKNGLPGPWDAGRLPLTALEGEGEWRGGGALVRALNARIGDGSITGQGAWKGAAQGWEFLGEVKAVDPAALHGAMTSLPLSGPVKLAGRGSVVEFDTQLRADGGASRPPRQAAAGDDARALAGALEWRDVEARGSWDAGWLRLPAVRLRTSNAELAGQVDVHVPQRAGSGKLNLTAPGLRASVEGELAQAKGRGVLALDAHQVVAARQWLARWPGVGKLLPDGPFGGSAKARIAWQGGWDDPSVQGRVDATNVLLTPPPGAAATAAAPPWLLRRLTATVAGQLRDARLEIEARAESGQRHIDLRTAGKVGHVGKIWRGEFASLEVAASDPALAPGAGSNGPAQKAGAAPMAPAPKPAAWHLTLRRPVAWSFGAARFDLAAGEATLRAPTARGTATPSDAVLAWAPVRSEGGSLQTTGRLSGLPMAWVELLGGPQLTGSALAGDMVFDAEWNAQLGDTLRVEASLTRVRGDVTVLAENADGAATRVPAGVRIARLTLRNEGDQLTLTGQWDSERAGTAQGQITTRLARAGGGWHWPADAPLAGTVKAQLPRLGVWSLLAPPGWRLRGAVTADVAVAGTRVEPLFTGTLNADDLALRSVVDGIELRNGRLRARLEGRKLVVSEFTLRGADDKGAGGGALVAFGEAAWTPQGLQLVAQAQLTRLRASIRDDRELTVSGPMQAKMDHTGTSITGQLEFDRARIQIPDETAPRLGADVVVRNAPGVPATDAERQLRPAPTGGGRTVTLTVSIDLGPDFRVRGRGVDTRLAGTLQMEGRSFGLPRLVGTIRTVGGQYEDYGQRMNIERGELRFTGPADNPALDVLAIRPNLQERVGVRITGRALAPHVELYSEAGLSEAQTLSLLVLGRSAAGGGAETALLQRAAAALLAKRGGGGGKSIASRIGLDDFSIGGSEDGGTVVRLGKRFADNFYATYERSLSGAMGTLYVFYDVSKRFTVRAEAGERSGLDLIFTFTSERTKK
jgi:translocation and assembly module TamB